MVSRFRLSLSDELHSFVQRNCGDGTLYVSAGDFIRDVLREKTEQLEAFHVRDAIVAGYQAAIDRKAVRY